MSAVTVQEAPPSAIAPKSAMVHLCLYPHAPALASTKTTSCNCSLSSLLPSGVKATSFPQVPIESLVVNFPTKRDIARPKAGWSCFSSSAMPGHLTLSLFMVRWLPPPQPSCLCSKQEGRTNCFQKLHPHSASNLAGFGLCLINQMRVPRTP